MACATCHCTPTGKSYRFSRPVSFALGVGAKGENSMAKANENTEREHRIMEEIMVDAYAPKEQAVYASPSEGKTCIGVGCGILG